MNNIESALVQRIRRAQTVMTRFNVKTAEEVGAVKTLALSLSEHPGVGPQLAAITDADALCTEWQIRDAHDLHNMIVLLTTTM